VIATNDNSLRSTETNAACGLQKVRRSGKIAVRGPEVERKSAKLVR